MPSNRFNLIIIISIIIEFITLKVIFIIKIINFITLEFNFHLILIPIIIKFMQHHKLNY